MRPRHSKGESKDPSSQAKSDARVLRHRPRGAGIRGLTGNYFIGIIYPLLLGRNAHSDILGDVQLNLDADY